MFWTVLFTCICAYCIWDWLKRKPFVAGRHQKCVFITGCDSGFGSALARRLDGQGVPVFAGCFTETGARDLKEKASDRLHTVLVDVASPESIANAYSYIRECLHDTQGNTAYRPE